MADETVAVEVDDRGLVSKVVVPARWKDTMRPHELGPALADAANRAMLEYVGARCAEDLDDPAVTEPPAPSNDAPEALVAEIGMLLDHFDADLAEYAARLELAANRPLRGEGGGGHVVATVVGGQVSQVEVDARWAFGARYTEIQVEAAAALRSAMSQVDVEAVPLPPSLARLRELTAQFGLAL